MFKNWFRDKAAQHREKHFRRGLSFERLESRRMLATIFVDTIDFDSSTPVPGHGNTLRSAINQANATPGIDIVAVPSSFSGQTLNLINGALTITEPVIVGTESGRLRINAGGATAVFDIDTNLSSGSTGTTQIISFEIRGAASGIRVTSLADQDSVFIAENVLANNGIGVEIIDGTFNIIRLSENIIVSTMGLKPSPSGEAFRFLYWSDGELSYWGAQPV